MEKTNPFDSSRFVGYLSKVSPISCDFHFPKYDLVNKFSHYGQELSGGIVGSFVVIEGENHGFLGKINEIQIPTKDQVFLNEKNLGNSDIHPIGQIELLISFNYFDRKINKGIDQFPQIGSKVYLSSPEFLKEVFESFVNKDNSIENLFEMATLKNGNGATISLNPESIFGRHCAVIGTTGGGKSFTVTNLLEELIRNKGKAILFDATGEYKTLSSKYVDSIDSYTFIPEVVVSPAIADKKISLHYTNLNIEDLFLMLNPSEQTQKPLLLEAIKSLKLIKLISEEESSNLNIKNGILIKQNQLKNPVRSLLKKYSDQVNSPKADFNFSNLESQIWNECVSSYEPDKWGGADNRVRDYAAALILRINNLLSGDTGKLNSELFGMGETLKSDINVKDIIENFMLSDKNILRISFENVPFESNIREVLVNAIGRMLLNKSRKGEFKESPLILFIDEAHQFINKTVFSESAGSSSLTAFDNIAKECRKLGLYLCLSTQMPKDIPIGTLSQIGTFFVHRIISENDRNIIEKATANINKAALSYLPILSAGEVLVVSVDLPMPIILKINEPKVKPDSETPFKKMFKGNFINNLEDLQE
ncbi:ATP-binding protein [Aliarcobacter butzleri]|uniref:ATP-binding protein n=1 Tax=Aliarcobacter butzleri TaxID=28197 RepID=UPI001865A579|nr:ATP-binding protein [Aliarcobacter butzleri]